MGSFSWLRADDRYDDYDLYRNIYEGCSYKFLIPTVFGGGFIIDNYRDYGYIGEPTDLQKHSLENNALGRYDAYELLAMWNDNCIVDFYDINTNNTLTDTIHNLCLKYFNFDTTKNRMKEIDKFTDSIRDFGIQIGCYDKQIDKLEFPLKFVYTDFEGNYEDCINPSYGDPDQGFYPVTWFGETTFDDEDDDEDSEDPELDDFLMIFN